MDEAVALVESYLHVNGYFTVPNYPVMLPTPRGFQQATDLDLLAFRFPEAGRLVRPGSRRDRLLAFETDPALDVPADRVDMIVAEVKQGAATFNPAAWRRDVLEVGLVRFGCCESEAAADVVRGLFAKGEASTPAGHTIRAVAFGSTTDGRPVRARIVTLDRVAAFLTDHLRRHWDVLHAAQFGGSALGTLAVLEKARRGTR